MEEEISRVHLKVSMPVSTISDKGLRKQLSMQAVDIPWKLLHPNTSQARAKALPLLLAVKAS